MAAQIIRNPVPAASLHKPLECQREKCLEARKLAGRKLVADHDASAKAPSVITEYACLNFKKGCERGAFLYPRSISIDPHFEEGYKIHYHQGIDIGGVDGKTEIISVIAGKVRLASSEPAKGYGGYGRFVEIEGVDGRYYLHAHCADVLVKTGDSVDEKTPIAIVGRTAFEGDEATQHEKAHCDALKAWRDAGASGKPPEPPPVQITNKKGELVTKKWMGPHLHLEISRHPFGSSHATITAPVPEPGNERKQIKVDRSIEDDYKDFTENPLDVLAELGPWSEAGSAAPKLMLPSGVQVTPKSTEAAHRANEEQSLGGYFPVGANNFWHGGVHLFGKLGAPVVAPFDATIVAVRLDENAEVGNQDFGSTNFVLLKHEIPKRVADLLAPVEKAPDSRQSKDSKAGGASGTKEASVGYQSSLEPAGADIPNPGRKPKKPATNPPEYVKEIKRRLNACPREDGRPYYDATSEDLESGEARWALVLAIYDFQRDGLKQRRPDGVINVAPGGVTYTELLSRTPTIPKAEEKSEKKDTEPPPSDANESKDSKDSSASDVVAVFSLFMHLDPRPIDAALAEQLPWLARARVKGDTAPASEDQEEREEAKRSMNGHVGPPNRKGIENLSDDVAWVQKRLTRFGLYALPCDGLANDDLTKSILDFQAKYVVKRDKADGIVSRNKQTADWLRKTPAEIREAASEVDGKFLKALRERDADGVCKVVSGLSVPVSAGEAVGLRGYGCSHNDLGIAPVVHWEIFSEQPLMLNWQDFQDENDDLSIDVTEPIADAIELLAGGHEADPRLTAGEVARYFNEGYGANLRQTRCLFPSEWSHEPSAVQQAFSQLGDPLADCVGKQVQPYQWWSQASDVVPSSPKVWHYNPIAFLAEYARASGGFDATVCVLVKRAGTPVAGAHVSLSAQGHKGLEATTGADGTAIVRAVSAGLYRASAVIEKKGTTTQTEVATAEGTIAVHPTETAAITLELQ